MIEKIELGSKFVDCSLDSSVLRITLNRPERRNACTMEMYNAIKRATIIADSRDEIRVLVLTGSGASFCVGGDMGGAEQETPGTLALQADPLDNIPFAHLERCTKIVITAINGHCHAGGMDLMMCSDISIASEQAVFRVPELLRGLADGWLGARLPQRVGLAKAKYLIFTAQQIDAREAERIGLISMVVPHEALSEKVNEVIQQVILTAPNAGAAMKKQMNQQLPPFDIDIFQRSVRSAEVIEGFSAFVEKRPPNWSK